MNTKPLPPLPIFVSVAFPFGNGYFIVPRNLGSHYRDKITCKQWYSQCT